MALSQVQCLDDSHVNPRTHESKAEFLYCEEQRLALELLLRDGREAFAKYVEARGLRGFLSDPELEALLGAVEPYDPGAELFPEGAEDGEPPLSLHYWPALSDTSVPRMDLGWPDGDSYRGVTRTTVYTQPPLDGQAHVKEVVRKMIAQAQKVIAVAMDVFTDVDIFRDLLDAGFKKRVSVYVLLERTALPHFLSMCRRANMHAGHLKHLRVRCSVGTEFYTRSCTKVSGRMGHRFMFVDGDKAVSGSYSFTWMSSRLDRNLITVVTGQAVDAFDRLFRFLYVTSSYVDLRKVATEPEPEPEPLPQPAAVVLPSAALARKLHNPKYALVAVANPTPSAEQSSPKETSNPNPCKNPDVPDTNNRRQKRASKEAVQDDPPLHPGLTDLEKACLIAYLPTWPEPDPPSDVIGFINIRDASKPTRVHLQRSEMFEKSKAIRFSSPISMPKEVLPEVAKPRQLCAKPEEMLKPQPRQEKTEAQQAQLDARQGDVKCTKEQAPEHKLPASGENVGPAKGTAAVSTENNLQTSTLASQEAGHNTIPHMAAHTPPQNPNPHSQGSLNRTHIVTTNSPGPESPPGPNTKGEATTSTPELNNSQSSHLHAASDLSTNTELTGLPLTTSHTDTDPSEPQNSSDMAPIIQTSTIHSQISASPALDLRSQSVTSTSLSENNHSPVTKTTSSPSISAVSSSLSPSTASSSLTPPIPKPRTVQLVIKHGGVSDGENLPEIVKRTGNLESIELQVIRNEPDVANVAQTPPEKRPETLQDVHNSTTTPEKHTENTGSPKEATQQQQQSATSHETKDEEAVGCYDNGAGTQARSHVLITEAPMAGSVNIQKNVSKEADAKSLPQTDCKITSGTKTDQTAAQEIDTESREKTRAVCDAVQVPNNNVMQHNRNNPKGQEPQRASRCERHPQESGPLETANSSKAPTQNSGSTSHVLQQSADDNNDRKESSLTSAPHTAEKHKAQGNIHPDTTAQEFQHTPIERGGSHTPERPLRLHLADTHTRDLRLPTSDQELGPLTALTRTPTPDGIPSRTPTPDSRTMTPGPRAFTPDFRTPTPDVSDGYVSPREDSTLSTTSEEFYECSDFPSQSNVGCCNHGTTDHVSLSHTNIPNATSISTTSTGPACINNSSSSSMLGTADRNNSSNETQTLPGPVSASHPSVHEQKGKTEAKGDIVTEENGNEEDEKERNVPESRTEQDSRGTERRGNEEAKITADQLKTEMDGVEKDTVSQPPSPKRQKAPNKLATESLVDGGMTVERSPTRRGDPRRLSSGGLRPDNVSSEAERPNKERTEDKRDEQQQPEDGSSSSQPKRPHRLTSAARPLGTRPWGSHQLSQAKSKALPVGSKDLENPSSHCRPSSRPPPPLPLSLGAAGFTTEQKRAKIQRGLVAQGRTRAGSPQSEHPPVKPQLSQEEGKSPFSITFGRLYSLKGLKDKMNKIPAQSRRGSTSSPVQRRKSTS